MVLKSNRKKIEQEEIVAGGHTISSERNHPYVGDDRLTQPRKGPCRYREKSAEPSGT